MLILRDTPRWRPDPSLEGHWVPATTPGALLLILAVRQRWTDRGTLGDILWPHEPRERQRHHLRITLHRLRLLLAGWQAPEGVLQTLDDRVRLQLASDVDRADGRLPEAWFGEFELRGAPGFDAWRRTLPVGRDAPAAEQPATTVTPKPAGTASTHAVAADDPRRPPELPGRGAELARLRRSTAPVVVVVGEPGIGKTALLAAAFPGSLCLRARETLSSLPYHLLRDALRREIPRLVAACRDRTQPLANYRLDLARLLPELAPDEPLPPLDALTARARLLAALEAAFEHHPMLWVDDLQWCDAPTLDWLAMLAEQGRPWRCSLRIGHDDGPAGRLVERLVQAGQAETLTLGALPPDAARAVCAAAADTREWPPGQLDEVVRRSAGHPFALQQWAMQLDRNAAPAARAAGPPPPLGGPPRSVVQLVDRRLQALRPAARALVRAAAVLAAPAPWPLLAAVAAASQPQAPDLADAAAAGLLGERRPESTAPRRATNTPEPPLIECCHDLIREATLAAMPAAQRTDMHRAAAQALQALWPATPAQRIADHWDAAGERQAALPWLHRAALHDKALGAFEAAQQRWVAVAEQASDPALRLRARLGLAEARLLDDLQGGRQQLLDIRAALGIVRDAEERRQIEGRCLASLVDNAVFSGEMDLAREAAGRLAGLVDGLDGEDRLHALEVLVEYTMRAPDLARAEGHVRQLELLAPDHAMTRSLRAQLHWVTGDVRAACEGFERLLQTHAAFARGQTLENDLGVMLHALGELPRAETLLRRSLQTWQGVPHTEALSSLALGSVLSSAGRWAEALESLDRALHLAREQGSRLFETEALTRLARLAWLQGDAPAAQARLDEARPGPALRGSPLPGSQLLATQAVVAEALRRWLDDGVLAGLQALAAVSPHPLVRVRLARAHLAHHRLRGDRAAAAEAAREQLRVAEAAGLLEWAVEAIGWLARLGDAEAAPERLTEARRRAAAVGLSAWAAWLDVANGSPSDTVRQP
jgi:tetratricopeptide (TPR) repeat protein